MVPLLVRPVIHAVVGKIADRDRQRDQRKPSGLTDQNEQCDEQSEDEGC